MKDGSENNKLWASKHEVVCSILTVQLSVKYKVLLVLPISTVTASRWQRKDASVWDSRRHGTKFIINHMPIWSAKEYTRIFPHPFAFSSRQSHQFWLEFSAFTICLGVDWTEVRYPEKVRGQLFSIASRMALRPNQPPILWVPGAVHYGVKLTTHLH
jgi:hypothetical protein